MIPVLFRIGPFEVSSFGALVALGFLAAGWLGTRSFARRGLPPSLAWDLLGWAALGGLLGAKLWYAAETLVRYPELRSLGALLEPGESPLLSRGGLTWYGGLLGGTLAVALAARRRGVPLLAVADGVAPSLALGQAIGRIGCFLVGDDYGRPTDLPWGVAFPRGLPPTEVPVHPTQLYEAAWLGAAAFVLWRRLERSPHPIAEYALLQGLGRFAIEFVRTNPPALGPFTEAQCVAAALALGGLAAIVAARRRPAAPGPLQGPAAS